MGKKRPALTKRSAFQTVECFLGNEQKLEISIPLTSERSGVPLQRAGYCLWGWHNMRVNRSFDDFVDVSLNVLFIEEDFYYLTTPHRAHNAFGKTVVYKR